MRYFIASRWKNKDLVKELTDQIKSRGHEVYSFLDSSANLLTGKPVMEHAIFFEEALKSKDWKSNPHIFQVFHSEIEGLRKSDVAILILPAGISSHLEAGIAYGLNKKLILIGKIDKPEISYLIFDKVYTTIDEFLADF